jgi:hypothetical protein
VPLPSEAGWKLTPVLMTSTGRRYLLAYLTAEGLLAEVDLVER